MRVTRSPPSPPSSQAIADAGARADRRQVRSAAVRHRRRGGDGAGRAGPARRPVHRAASSRSRPSRPTSPRSSPSRRAMSRPASRRPRSSSRAATPPSRCTRPISSRMPASRPTAPTARCTIYSSSQGHFMVRAYTAKLLGIDMSNIRVTPAEIGGGFGGKTLVYLEPLALALSKKSGRPVKMQMTREEVFRASGPTSGATMEVKIGAKKDGTIVAAQAGAEVPGRRVPRLADRAGLHVRLRACMTCRTSMSSATTWSATGRRSRPIARRARRSRPSRWKARSTIWRASSAWTRSTLREKNAAKNGTKTHYGPTHQNIGFLADAGGGEEPSALEVAAEAGPGAGHRLRLLVQHRRRVLGGGARQRGRLGQSRCRAARISAARAPRSA